MVTITRSDTRILKGTVAFGFPETESIEAGGKSWTRVRIPGLEERGADNGYPAVPVLRRLMALPRGAEVTIDVAEPVVAEVREVDLYPYQLFEGEYPPRYDDEMRKLPPGKVEWPPPFTSDEEAYRKNADYPRVPCSVYPIGDARGLRLAVLEIAAGRYNPVERKLSLYGSVSFTVSFTGGSGEFVPPGDADPFDGSLSNYAGIVLNADDVDESMTFDIDPSRRFDSVGEQLLILTHPRYREAADRLAAYRRLSGILTTVVEVNDGNGPGPDTKEEIDAFIDDRFHSTLVNLSYLLLIGDSDDIETWILPRRYKDGDFATDFPYAEIDRDPYDTVDLLPDIAVGRIAVESAEEAATVVDKIIRYEEEPPPETLESYYHTNITIASYFECCTPPPPTGVENYRSAIKRSEELFRQLTDQHYNVERIYTTNTDHHPDYTGDPTPRYYKDGTPLPAPLRPEDGFRWDGSTQDVIDAFNAGRLFIFHLDHGDLGMWENPYFGTSRFYELTNRDRLPVVFNDNCYTGMFDYDRNYCFAERILRIPYGGAAGVFAFTRLSNSGAGYDMIRGAVAALWPDVYPDFNVDGMVRHRLGDVFNLSRARIAHGHVGENPDTRAYKVAWCYVRMLTLFGDPAMTVVRNKPRVFDGRIEVIVDGPAFELRYAVDGAVITALEPTERGLSPVGLAVVSGGTARMEFVVPPKNIDAVEFYASAPDRITRKLNANIER